MAETLDKQEQLMISQILITWQLPNTILQEISTEIT